MYVTCLNIKYTYTQCFASPSDVMLEMRKKGKERNLITVLNSLAIIKVEKDDLYNITYT